MARPARLRNLSEPCFEPYERRIGLGIFIWSEKAYGSK